MMDVYINKTAAFLPNAPVSNPEMEDYLGYIDGKSSKVKPIILRNNGIKTRYYALDKNGKSTHNNAALTQAAILRLCDEAFDVRDIELLSCGTSTPDQLLPAHASMVHGLLKTDASIALNTAAGVCNSGMNALNYGYLSIKAGVCNNAVCTGSERVSNWLHADKFTQEVANLKSLEADPIIAFRREFLRWMLSDGAAAFLLENKPRSSGSSLKIEFIDFYSYAHELEVCMYAGGEKDSSGQFVSWLDVDPDTWLSDSIFAIKQDTKLLGDNILQKGADSLLASLDKHAIDIESVDYVLAHISSQYFKERLKEAFINVGLHVPEEKWFYNLSEVGNVGSASIFMALDQLINNNVLEKGQKILLCVPESGRFSYSICLLTVC